MASSVDDLVALSRNLGKPELNLAIIGEGNTSLRVDEKSFWIKASGKQLNNISSDGFVRVYFQPILALFDDPPLTLTQERESMRAARVNALDTIYPSVETTFHAMLLKECDVTCIAHTHPIAVNRLLCSNNAELFARRRMFPDEIVLCGPESVFVPYVDPGLPLAQAIQERVRAYMAKYGEAPRMILLANHGLITLGKTTTEAFNVTLMAVKAAEILFGALCSGTPQFLSEEEVRHIYRRPDEIYRRKMFAANPGESA